MGAGITYSPEHTTCKVAPRLGSSLRLGPREPRLPHPLVVFPPLPPSLRLRTTLLRVRAPRQAALLRIEAALAVTRRGAGRLEPSLADGLHHVGFTIMLRWGQGTEEALAEDGFPVRGWSCALSGRVWMSGRLLGFLNPGLFLFCSELQQTWAWPGWQHMDTSSAVIHGFNCFCLSTSGAQFPCLSREAVGHIQSEGPRGR